MKSMTRCIENYDGSGTSADPLVIETMTSLFYHTYTACRTKAEQTGGSYDPR